MDAEYPEEGAATAEKYRSYDYPLEIILYAIPMLNPFKYGPIALDESFTDRDTRSPSCRPTRSTARTS